MKRMYPKKLSWIAGVIALAAVAFFSLVSVQEKHDVDLGMPELSLPNADSLGELLESIEPEEAVPAMSELSGGVQVHFIDVGQGKSILIKAPEKNVLIDAGERDQGVKVLRYLLSQGIETLDIVIATHPHSDHIGGLGDVIDESSVLSVSLPVVTDELVPTTAAYTRLLEAIARAGLKIIPAKPDVSFDLGEGAELVILGPLENHEYDDLNNYSIVCRLDYGKTSFLFTGDSDGDAERDMLAAGVKLRARVLDVAHHGSSGSTAKDFLDEVSPELAVISCGLDNKYGHPHREVMNRLKNLGVTIARTDLDGSVVVYSDGESLGVETEKGRDSR